MHVDDERIRRVISDSRRSTRAANAAAEQLEMELVRFKADSRDIEFSLDISGDTVWATQQQIADLFGIDRSGVDQTPPGYIRLTRIRGGGSM